MIGTVGDRLVELAAGWGVVLVVSGVFLWWPRGQAAGILWPLTGTLLNPVVAGAAMALSSITVVSNANRLLRFKPKD